MDSAIAQSELWFPRIAQQIAQTKNNFTFWLIFGLSPNLGLSKRLIQKMKRPSV